MPIGLTDIDARIAKAFREQADTLWSEGTENEEWTEEQRRAYRVMDERESRLIDQKPWLFFGVWGAMAALWGGSFWWIVANDFPTSLGIPGLAVLFGGAYGVTKGLGVWLQSRAGPVAVMQKSLLAEEVRSIAPLQKLSRAERVYCEVIALLLDLESQIDETTAREVVGQLNVLLENSRQLDAQRADLVVAMGQISVVDLEQERGELARRLEQVQDPIARQTLQQSVELCESRLESARTLLPMLERLDAQQEVILQTFSSVQSALGRMKVAPAPLRAPDVEAVRQSVTQINNQTRAVEQAVQEVIALRAAA